MYLDVCPPAPLKMLGNSFGKRVIVFTKRRLMPRAEHITNIAVVPMEIIFVPPETKIPKKERKKCKRVIVTAKLVAHYVIQFSRIIKDADRWRFEDSILIAIVEKMSYILGDLSRDGDEAEAD